MRKVKFNKWIPFEYIQLEGGSKTSVKGTGCWETHFPNEGVFHKWGNAYEEFESGAGNYSIAIVEMPDGKIESVLPSNLIFVD